MKLFFRTLVTICLGCLFGSQHLYAQKQASKYIDSLLQELPKAVDDTNKVLLLDDLSFGYYTNNTDEGLKYGNEELELAQKLGWKKGIALAYNSIGDNYMSKTRVLIALDYFFKAIKINEELGEKLALAKNYNHVGVIYKNQKYYPQALDYYLKALKLNEAGGNKRGVALNLGNIGNIHTLQGDYDKAREYHFQSLKMYEALADSDCVAHLLGNIALSYKYQHNYTMALEYYLKGNAVNEGVSNAERGIILGQMADCYLLLAKAIPGISVKKKALLAKSVFYSKAAMETNKYVGSLIGMMNYAKQMYEAEELAGKDKDALESYMQYMRFNDSVYSQQNNEQIAMIDYDRMRRADSVKTADEKKVSDLKIKHQLHYSYAGIAVIVLLLGFTFFIVKERRKSEKLLLNILPAEVAEELKTKGVTKARHFDNVTVLFTDFVNFTEIGERTSPQELIDELHTCFMAFDEITAKYGIEKIKTIGDAYLAVAGLPVADPKHAENVVKAAIEINTFINDRKTQNGNNTFEICIGIHSGSVVAGIVGVKKFAYDIWGDTVNTAARMQQNSIPGKINISQATYELVKDKFDCTYRGAITVKNKGEMNMYFAESAIEQPI